MNKWEQLANTLYLNPQENKTLYDWKKEQTSRSCLDLFLVFKAHNRGKEAQELLTWALVFQPKTSGLLSNLAREFLNLGHFHDAWHALQINPFEVKQTPLGLNTLFLSALGLGKKEEAKTYLSELEKERTYDTLALKMIEAYKAFGFEASRRLLVQYYLDRRHTIEGGILASLAFIKLKQKPLALDFIGKKGTYALSINKQEQDAESGLEDRAHEYIWKKLEKVEQRLECLRQIKGRIKPVIP